MCRFSHDLFGCTLRDPSLMLPGLIAFCLEAWRRKQDFRIGRNWGEDRHIGSARERNRIQYLDQFPRLQTRTRSATGL